MDRNSQQACLSSRCQMSSPELGIQACSSCLRSIPSSPPCSASMTSPRSVRSAPYTMPDSTCRRTFGAWLQRHSSGQLPCSKSHYDPAAAAGYGCACIHSAAEKGRPQPQQDIVNVEPELIVRVHRAPREPRPQVAFRRQLLGDFSCIASESRGRRRIRPRLPVSLAVACLWS
jgi:hypothetical protein